jgi:hypothetical protein
MSDVTDRVQAGASTGPVGSGPPGADDDAIRPNADGRHYARLYRRRLAVAIAAGAVAYVLDLVLASAHGGAAAVIKVVVSVVTVAAFGFLGVAWRSFLRSARSGRARYAGLPPDSPQVASRAGALRAYLHERAARYGEEFAATDERFIGDLFRTNVAYLSWVLYTLAYLNLYAHLDYLGGLYYFVIALPLVGVALWFLAAARRSSTSATELFAAALESGTRPPGPDRPTPAEYLAACAASGVPAYPYGSEHGPDAQ